jgi:hypothetical protein
MHRLESAFRKLSRGIHHRNEANRLIQAFVRAKPYALRIEFDSATGDKRWVIDRVLRAPPLGISISVGDCIYNLRSALDHLAWQLVFANGSQPTERTAFPLCDTADEWRRWWKNKTKGMSDPAIALIKSYQPCFQTHPYRAKWASWLDTLCNLDKHRHLYVTLAATSGGMWSQPIPYDARWFIHNGPIANGTVMASIEKAHADVDFGFFGDIAFGNPGPASDEVVYPTLIALGIFVETVLQDFGLRFFPMPLPSSRRTRRRGSI